MRSKNPFSTSRDVYKPLIDAERFLLTALAATAIASTTTPILWTHLPKEVKLLSNIWGVFVSGCFTAECYRRQRKEKFYNSIEEADYRINVEQQRGDFVTVKAVAEINAQRELAAYVNQLPIEERGRWVQKFNLHGLVELPQIQQAVIEQPRRLQGSTIPNPEIAEVNEDVVQSIINPGVMAVLQELSAQYPEYIRLDDQWVDELCDSSALQNMSDRANHHFSFWGETQSGKSTLAGVFINKVAAKSQGAALIFGSDPKNYVTRWLCKFSRKFDGFMTKSKESVLDQWIKFATKIIDARQEQFKNNRKGEGLNEIFLIQDEVNVVYGEGKGLPGQINKDVAGELCAMWNYIINFTAAMKIHGVFMGQNPLSGYTGFSRPSLKNICFICLGKVSGYVLSNPKDFLNVKSEIIDLLKNVCELLDKQSVRYALVVPTRGNPFVALIPTFDIDSLEQQDSPAETPQQTETKDTVNWYEILTNWVRQLGRNPTDDELKAAWQEITNQQLNGDGVKLLRENLGLLK